MRKSKHVAFAISAATSVEFIHSNRYDTISTILLLFSNEQANDKEQLRS